MKILESSPTADQSKQGSTDRTSTTNSTRPPYKLETSITLFVERGDKGMYQQEANQEYGESCLHTVVSTLTHKHGIKFRTEPCPVVNRVGTTARFVRYFLADGMEVKAQQLINHYRKRRNLAPIPWEA